MDSEGGRFKQARKALGLTLQDLVAMTGYSISTISGVENGHDAPSKRLRALLVERLDLNESWLRDGKGEMFAESQEVAFAKLVTGEEKTYSPEEQFVMEDKDFVTVINKLRVLSHPERNRWVKAMLRLLDELIAMDKRKREKLTVSEELRRKMDEAYLEIQQEIARETLKKRKAK